MMTTMALPSGDHTPSSFDLPASPSVVEWAKRPIRRLVYPAATAVASRFLAKRPELAVPFVVDRWLWGQKGNDYQAKRRRVNQFLSVRGRDVLVLGCGTGNDLPSWYPFRPHLVRGVDWFSYERAWAALRAQAEIAYPSVKVEFTQGDIGNLSSIPDGSFDVVASDAVLEHVSELQPVITEAYRVLRPEGVFYASWGALWYSLSGDHISGHDCLATGYNHLLMAPQEYEAWLASKGPYTHDPLDGRVWIRNGLFSHLRPDQYIDTISSRFEILHTEAVIEPRAFEFARAYPGRYAKARASVLRESDLLIMGMTVFTRRKRHF